MEERRNKSSVHWGNWVAQRGEFVGFKRQEDLAKAVGASRQHLAKWLAMDRPPKHMRKGFDRTLARALMTTHDVLFRDYASIPPEASARISFHHDQVYPLPSKPGDLLFWPLSNVLNEIVARLHQQEAVKVAEYAIQLVLAKNDGRRIEFEALRDRTIWEAPSGKSTDFPPAVVKKAIAKYTRGSNLQKKKKSR